MMARRSRASRSGGRRSPRLRTSQRTGVVEIFTRPDTNPVLGFLALVLRLRAELTVLTLALIARFWIWPRLDHHMGHPTALLAVTVLVLSILVVPASRRYWL